MPRAYVSGVEPGEHERQPRAAIGREPHRYSPVLLVHVAGRELRGARGVGVGENAGKVGEK